MTRRYCQHNDKSKDLRSHFKKKLKYRFGVILNRFEYRDFLEYVKTHAVTVRKETNMKVWVYLRAFNNDLYILYDTHREECITVYTKKIMIESSTLKNIEFNPSDYSTY